MQIDPNKLIPVLVVVISLIVWFVYTHMKDETEQGNDLNSQNDLPIDDRQSREQMQ